MNPTAVVAYLVLFGSVGLLFVFAGLLLGRFLRAHVPTPEKQEIYECGEPPTGSGYLQFDLRFYVVALVFLIFEVELALFFPWAVVFGKATQLSDPQLANAAATTSDGPVFSKLRELGIQNPADAAAEPTVDQIQSTAGSLALTAMLDMAVFFAVLLVGFAYVWHRGDLDWVRAIARPNHPTEPDVFLARGDA